jgi:hypothetical protein
MKEGSERRLQVSVRIIDDAGSLLPLANIFRTTGFSRALMCRYFHA